MDPVKIKTIVEAALMAAGKPLSVDEIITVFGDFSRPERKAVRQAIASLQDEYSARAIEIKEVASGFRIQVRSKFTEFISRLWEERPPRYSRALLETLALVAYRQPITRGEIEEVRGVSVSTNIVRTLLERNWVRVVGHKDVPGRPAMFGTTKEFLDYFGLRKLNELPSLQELRDLDDLNVQLELPTGEADVTSDAIAGTTAGSENTSLHEGPPRIRLVSNDAQQIEGEAEESGDSLTEDTDSGAVSHN